jgi:hypothetical protein
MPTRVSLIFCFLRSTSLLFLLQHALINTKTLVIGGPNSHDAVDLVSDRPLSEALIYSGLFSP